MRFNVLPLLPYTPNFLHKCFLSFLETDEESEHENAGTSISETRVRFKALNKQRIAPGTKEDYHSGRGLGAKQLGPHTHRLQNSAAGAVTIKFDIFPVRRDVLVILPVRFIT